jgi:hypothetical protein
MQTLDEKRSMEGAHVAGAQSVDSISVWISWGMTRSNNRW